MITYADQDRVGELLVDGIFRDKMSGFLSCVISAVCWRFLEDFLQKCAGCGN